jgi:very-short-patch-repair endonuclease
MKYDNSRYNKNLQSNANELRKNMTKSEAFLWKFALKSGKMMGYKFRRQRPVLNFIADFMCKDLNLIIELDGITHDNLVNQNKDKLKDTQLRKAGFAVLRFTDKDVLNNIEGVINNIEVEIKNILNGPPPSADADTSAGGGHHSFAN